MAEALSSVSQPSFVQASCGVLISQKFCATDVGGWLSIYYVQWKREFEKAVVSL